MTENKNKDQNKESRLRIKEKIDPGQPKILIFMNMIQKR